MACESAAIADDVVAWLNDAARGWPTTGWTATRTWAPDVELPDLTSETVTVPLVEVTPDSTEPATLDTRASEEQVRTIFIVVRAKYGQTGAVPNSWVDPLAELAEQIADKLVGVEFAVGKKAVCEEAKTDPLIDPVDLRERRTATSVIEATFRVYRVS